MNCSKCHRPETQFVLVGFICRHADCGHFTTNDAVEAQATAILVERYTGNNLENQPGQDLKVES